MADHSVGDALPAKMMRITVAGGHGGPDTLRTETAPTPSAGIGDIVVRVMAAGVNRPDILQRQGLYPPPAGAPDTLGLEIAGTVVAVGANVSRWKVGDAVCALLAGGGYAQYVALDARQAMRVPPGLGMIEAAALPETVLTVFSNVFERARLSAGETLLVHGATSGIGVMAILMGRAAAPVSSRPDAAPRRRRRHEVSVLMSRSMPAQVIGSVPSPRREEPTWCSTWSGGRTWPGTCPF